MPIWPFATSRVRPWRVLKALVAELRGIRLALERHNQLQEALYPDAVRWAEKPEEAPSHRESQISYVDPQEILEADRIREQTFLDTGRWLSDEELVTRLDQALGLSAREGS